MPFISPRLSSYMLIPPLGIQSGGWRDVDFASPLRVPPAAA
jgi:hypothetical protein